MARSSRRQSHIVTLTTDFGPGEYVGAMRGTILSIDPNANVVDLDHLVRPQDIRHGAYVLLAATPFYPYAAHVAVVDPGVGTDRRGLVVVSDNGLLVGPDNGLLLPAARKLGLREVRKITNQKLMASHISDTFHGRDVFAPVAAHLMNGTSAKEVGPAVKDFVDLDFGEPRKVKGGFEGDVITYDRFGNIVTNIPRAVGERAWSFGDRLGVIVSGYEVTVPLVRNYAEVPRGEFLATFSSSGFLELARREGNAAAHLNAAPRSPVVVTHS
jgi:S-adenosyl-L-methionine hydrolase (adenosine-forming)